MAATVRARPGPRVSMRRAAFHENVTDTLWFVPMCCAIAAMVLSVLALVADNVWDLRSPSDSVLPGDPDELAAAAAVVAAAMLTFLGVVFSTTVVAVQLASSQYSPRIVRVFVRSRLTQATLGVFLATFVFSVNTLVGTRQALRPEVPAVTLAVLYLLVLATVAMFIAYIHGIVRLLRVQYLLRLTARHSHPALEAAFPPAAAYVDVSAPPSDGAVREVRTSGPAQGHRSGARRVLQAVDVAGLADLALQHACWIELAIAVGEHAGPRTVVARVHGADPEAVTDRALHANLLFGGERTVLQDPAFGLRQLVDTAGRALSPAINDPTTGVQALLRVGDLLARIADRPDPTGWYTAEDGSVRVRLVEDDFERLARLGFTEILRYGSDSPQVVRALLAAYDDLESMVTPDRVPLVIALRAQCLEASGASMPPAFAELARQPDRQGLG